jgi:hypothetical protein
MDNGVNQRAQLLAETARFNQSSYVPSKTV